MGVANPEERKTNKEFVKDKAFVRACEFAHVQPTARQASKYRNRRGLAYTMRARIAGKA